MRLALLAAACLALTAWAQNPCDECRNAALAQSAVCHRNALNPTDAAECNVKLAAAREECQAQACRSQARELRWALCSECAKSTGAARARCEKTFCAPPTETRAPSKGKK